MHRSLNQNRRAGGFTLIEILVVIVVILLMIGMAMPVFRIINGSRSEQGAANNVSAMLGRARADAIGLERPIGVAFVYNPLTQLTAMAEVEFPPVVDVTYTTSGTTQFASGQCVQKVLVGTQAAGDNPAASTYYWVAASSTTAVPIGNSQTNSSGAWYPVIGPPIEMRADTDLVPLPGGVSAQTIYNAQVDPSSHTRQTTGYMSVGVIFFDGKGRLAALPYGISVTSKLISATGLTQSYPHPSQGVTISAGNTFAATTTGTAPSIVPQFGVLSQFGLVLFQRDAYVGQGFVPNEAAYTTPNFTGPSSGINFTQQKAAYTALSGTQSEQSQDAWLDQNSTPLLIDRYTGELIKAE
jgi:prepilin-type N-terminal cleavage/methylation domain-containing protein